MRKCRIVRGSSLPIQVPLTVTPEDIKEAAAAKHEAVDRSLRCGPYSLLFPDGTQVEQMPGSTDAFSLPKYKAFLGKSYRNLKLYLSPMWWRGGSVGSVRDS